MKKAYKELKVFDTQTMGEAGHLLQQLETYEEVANDQYVSYHLPLDGAEQGADASSHPDITKFLLEQGCKLGEQVIVFRWW